MEHLEIIAFGDVENIKGGVLSSGGSMVVAGENIRSLTEVERGGTSREYWSRAGAESRIEAGGMLMLSSSKDVLNRGSSIKAGSLAMSIGGSFTSVGLELASGRTIGGGLNHGSDKSVVFKPAGIEIEGDVGGVIAGDFNLIGSKIKAGGDLSLSVGGDVVIASQVGSTQSMRHSASYKSSWGGSKRQNSDDFSYEEQVTRGGLEIGGRSLLSSGGSQSFIGAELSSGGGTSLEASKTSFLALETRSIESHSKNSRNLVWQSSKESGHDRSGVVTTSVRGGLEVDSGSIEIQVASRAVSTAISGPKDGVASIASAVEQMMGSAPVLEKESWMTELESRGHSINYTGVQEKDKSWNVKQSGLTPEAATLVSVVATAATMWSGGVGGAAAQSLGLTTSAGGLTTTGIVVAGSINAGVGTLASRTAVSAINNRFDLSKVAREVTSEESLKDIGRSMLIGGATAGLQKVVDLEKVTAGVVQLPELGQRAVQMTGRGLVQASVSSLVTGEKFGDALKSAAGSTALALGQSVVGDVGVSAGLGEGSLGKVAMHAGLGGLYSKVTGGTFASGAIGGGVSEAMMPSSKLEDPSKLVPVVGAFASFVTGGSAKDITTASSVASSVVENNRRLHSKELDILKELQQGKSRQEQERLKEAAMYLTGADEGVNPEDSSYAGVKAGVERGKGYVAEQQQLIARGKQDGGSVFPGTDPETSYDSMDEELFAHSIKEREPFSYSLGDGMSDFTSRHRQLRFGMRKSLKRRQNRS